MSSIPGYIFAPGARLPAVAAFRRATSPPVRIATYVLTGGALVAAVLFVSSGGAVSLLGVSLVFGSLGAAGWLTILYGQTYFPHHYAGQPIAELTENVAAVASFQLLTILGPAAARGTLQALAGSIALLWPRARTQQLLKRLQIDPPGLWEAITTRVVPHLTWETFSFSLLQQAKTFPAPQLMPEHALAAWLLHPTMHSWWRTVGLREQDVEFVLWWLLTEQLMADDKKRWWRPDHFLRFTGIGLAWTSGYTPLVDQFAYFPRGNLWDILPLGRESQIDQIINTIARSQGANVLLVGQPGVGRLGVVREVQRRVEMGQAHPALVGQRMVYIHVGELLAMGNNSAGQIAAVSHILRQIEQAGNIIAVLDGLGSILGEGGEQRVNMTDVLLPFFSSSAARVIVIVSSEEYHLRLASNSELNTFFDVVTLESLSEEDTLRVVALVAPVVERRHQVYLPYQTIRAVVEGTSSLLPNIPFPQRAFDFIAEAVTAAQGKGITVIEPAFVNALISRKVGVPVGEVPKSERERLLQLGEVMHKRIVNQEVAITAVTKAMLRARAQVRTLKRPIGTFLFLGPTGVGKTETAKTLAEAYFGHEDSMVRLDMSEFSGHDAPARLLGSIEQTTGRLTALIAEHPFAVVLLDEFEKASPEVHQLFLSVFDEGYLTDVRGQTLSFKHTIIIATSNAGAEFIRQAVAHGPLPEDFAVSLRDQVLRQGIFRPELLNRFDGIVTFTPLSKEHIAAVARLMLNNLNKRLDEQHGVTVAITPELINYLTRVGYNPEFGARPMARAIQDTVEYMVARQVLNGELKPGTEIVLNPTLFNE